MTVKIQVDVILSVMCQFITRYILKSHFTLTDFLDLHYVYKSCDSSVGIVAGYGLDNQGFWV
jgi:hypothetical protein